MSVFFSASLPEGVEQPGGLLPVVSQECVPDQQGADRLAGGAAWGDYLVPLELLLQEPREHPDRKCRVATAALARYRNAFGLSLSSRTSAYRKEGDAAQALGFRKALL